MRHLIRITAVLFCVLGILQCPQAQTRAQRVGVLQDVYGDNIMVSLVPVPLAFNGFRLDVDCRLKDRLWLQIAPQYNCKRKGVYTKLDGFCLEANVRYYLKNSSSRGFYLASGIGLDYNQIQQGKTDEFEVETKEYGLNSTRFGGQIQLGYSFNLWPRALMDLYVGAAFRHSFNSYDSEDSRMAVEAGDIKPWQYHFSGLYMQVGVRIGMMFGK